MIKKIKVVSLFFISILFLIAGAILITPAKAKAEPSEINSVSDLKGGYWYHLHVPEPISVSSESNFPTTAIVNFRPTSEPSAVVENSSAPGLSFNSDSTVGFYLFRKVGTTLYEYSGFTGELDFRAGYQKNGDLTYLIPYITAYGTNKIPSGLSSGEAYHFEGTIMDNDGFNMFVNFSKVFNLQGNSIPEYTSYEDVPAHNLSSGFGHNSTGNYFYHRDTENKRELYITSESPLTLSFDFISENSYNASPLMPFISDAEHFFGAWIETVPATSTSSGIKGHYVCEICGKNFDANGNEIENLYLPRVGVGLESVEDLIVGETYHFNNTDPAVRDLFFNSDYPEVYIVATSISNVTPALTLAGQCPPNGYSFPYSEFCFGFMDDGYCALFQVYAGVGGVLDEAGAPAYFYAMNFLGEFDFVFKQIPSLSSIKDSEHLTVLLSCISVPCQHDFEGDWTVVAATCEEAGYKYKTCSLCGEELRESTGESATGHTFGEWIEAVAPTTFENGYAGHYTCEVCGKHFDSEHNELSSIILLRTGAVTSASGLVVGATYHFLNTAPIPAPEYVTAQGNYISYSHHYNFITDVEPTFAPGAPFYGAFGIIQDMNNVAFITTTYNHTIDYNDGSSYTESDVDWYSSFVGEFDFVFHGAVGNVDFLLPYLTRISDCEHDFQSHSGVSPSCAPGMLFYEECRICGIQYYDVEHTLENQVPFRADLSLQPVADHQWVLVPAVSPTCTENGFGAYYTCSACGHFALKDSADNYFEYTFPELQNILTISPLGHHMGELQAGSPATRTSEGVIEHYICYNCGKYFADEVGQNELSSIVIPKLWTVEDFDVGVSLGNKVVAFLDENISYYMNYGVLFEYIHIDSASSFYYNRENSSASSFYYNRGNSFDFYKLTDEELLTINNNLPAGTTVYSAFYIPAFVRDHDFNREVSYIVDNLGTGSRTDVIVVGMPDTVTYSNHVLSTVNRKNATCTEVGHLSYKVCFETNCEGKFFDENGNEVTWESLELPALGHQYGDWTVVSATCTEDGYRYKTCSACGDVIRESTGESATGRHTFIWIEETPATTSTSGMKAHFHCDACGKDFDRNYEEVSANSLKTEPLSNYSEKKTDSTDLSETVSSWIKDKTGLKISGTVVLIGLAVILFFVFRRRR